MKKLYTLLILAGYCLYAYSQHQAVSFTLNQPISGPGHHYQALEYIDMLPGFEYEAQNLGEEFIAELNPLLVFPPDEGITGGPNEGDKGLVGATAGTFAVSETGQATYVIPLEFPGGIGGMTPDLSLVYNSNGGDGILGPGWSLGGLSVINLVPANRYYDGIIETANGGDYSQDAYTLDGQRLILVHNDGNNNLTFKTEQDVFSKIMRKNIPPDPEVRDEAGKQFEVKTKSGLTYFYGEKGYPDSRLRHNIGTSTYTIAYYVNKIVDNFDNEIKFTYHSVAGDADENLKGEIYIDEITYTGNGDIEPMYRIKFNYHARNSPQITYYSYQPALSPNHPIAFQTDRLIDTITCTYIPDGSVVKKYALEYIDRGPGTNATNKTQHLASIQEFGLNGEEEYNKTVFEWEEEMDYQQWELSTISLPETYYEHLKHLPAGQVYVRKRNHFVFDISNNKNNDILRVYEIYFRHESGTSNVYYHNHFLVFEFLIKDNNGNYYRDDSKRFSIRIQDEYEQVQAVWPIYHIKIGDFNGDGFNDILCTHHKAKIPHGSGHLGTNVNLFVNQGDYHFSDPYNIYSSTNTIFTSYTADFNGDGVSDLLLRNNSSGALIFRLGNTSEPLLGSSDELNGATLDYTTHITIDVDKPIQVMDMNGDGRAEIIVKTSNTHKEIRAISFDSNGNMHIGSKTIAFSDSDHNFAYSNTDRKADIIKHNFNTECLNDNCSEFNSILRLEIKHGHGVSGFSEIGSYEIVHYFDESHYDDDGEVNFDGAFEYIDNIYFADFNSNGQNEILVSYTISLQYTEYGESSGNYPYPETYYIYFKYRKLLLPTSEGSDFSSITLPTSPALNSYKVGVMEATQQSHLYKFESQSYNNNVLKLYSPSPHGSRINRITNGMGAVTIIDYAYSSDPEVYTPGAEVEYPVIPYEANQALVKKVRRDVGQDGFLVEEYHYEKARAHTEGLGYLGFEKTIRTDVTRGIVHTTKYALDTEFYYTYPEEIATSTTGGNTVKITTNNYTHRKTAALHGKFYYYVHPETSTTLYYELGQAYPYKGERITYTGFDLHGNPGTIKTEYGIYTGSSITYTHSTQVEHQYKTPDTDNWILGRLETATTTFKAPNTPDIIRKASFEYYDSSERRGMLRMEITEPDKLEYSVEKEYVYDDYGNILTTTSHAPFLGQQHDRITITTYEDGRFVKNITNPEGHTTSRIYEAERGLLLQETDPNNITTTVEYTAFGQPAKTIAHDGTQTASALRWVQTGDPMAPPYATYYSWSQSSGSAPVRIYYNRLGMELSTVTMDFGGEAVFVETQYNNKNQVSAKSEPHKSNAEYFTHFQYDAIGRVNTITHPDNSQTQIAYNGLSTTTTNALSQTSQKAVNAAGWLTTSTDAAGGKVRHTYYANGLVESTYVWGHNNTKREYAYDIVGNLVSYSDASQGDIDYQYNAFGELTQQTTPKGTTTYPEYDKLGRLRKRESLLDGTTTWEYDRPGEKGLIYEEKLVADNQLVHQLIYEYDPENMLRLNSISETIELESFTKSYDYDIFGRLRNQTFPSGYAVEYTYNAQGYQNKVIEAGTGNTLWEALEMNERNQFTEIKLGNNITQISEYFDATGRIKKIQAGSLQNNTYTWDPIGNLQTRKARHNTTESFTYDNLNRLNTVSHNATLYTSINYDVLGNITHKSDVGSYSYDPTNPYKLTSVDNRPPTINADNQHIEYNSFNKVTQITEEDPVTNAILRQLDLVYGTGNQRIFQQMQNGQNLTAKYYVGNDYEVENKDGAITRVHYIFTPSGLAAIVKRDQQNNDELNFVLNDHLGSIQVLANAAGQLLEEFSYDPWGLRRDPVTLAVYAWAAMPATGMDYGFTGHEHLDIFMLVNMNGRIYDPTIGRFLSPDPVLQFPNFTQGLNPYAYALNNPLRFVDPDGYSLVGQLIAISVQIAFTSVGLPMVGVLAYSVIMTIDYAIEQGRNVKAGDLFGYFMQTFVMSAISVGVTQGIGAYYNNLSGAQKSAIELRRALAHGTFNGAMRFAQGGKFEHGFMSGFVSSLGGTAINDPNMNFGTKVAMSAVIGGTAEKLGGGKFANGAVTGAYVMMFNHLQTQRQMGVPEIELNEKQRLQLQARIKQANLLSRNRWANYDPHTMDDRNPWSVDMTIEGVEPGCKYYSQNMEIWIGNENLLADITYLPNNVGNIVDFIRMPGTDFTSQRIWFENQSMRGNVLEIRFYKTEDLIKYDIFIRAKDTK